MKWLYFQQILPKIIVLHFINYTLETKAIKIYLVLAAYSIVVHKENGIF